MQNAARAGRYSNLESLYEELLSTINQETANVPERRFREKKWFKHSLDGKYRIQKRGIKEAVVGYKKCYKKSAAGLLLKQASFGNLPQKECEKCKRLGHDAENCRKQGKNVLKANTYKVTGKSYFVDCVVNRKITKGYLDTGCKAVTISRWMQICWKLNISIVSLL